MTTNFLQNLEILKYPRTPHLEGSRLQKGDEGYEHVPYSRIAGRYIVVEEKIDGGNSGISYSPGGEQLLQSRGHYLTGGGSERQFALFKRWAAAHEDRFLEALEDRYVMYGEWTHKKHSVFYDWLPHYFHEFDVWDRSRGVFLSTAARQELLHKVPVLSVPVLFRGRAPSRLIELFMLLWRACDPTRLWENERSLNFSRIRGYSDMLLHSFGKSEDWRDTFEKTVKQQGYDLAKCWKQTDSSDKSEGLYIKVEEDGVVVERYKWVRHDFVQTILDSAVHHSKQPFVPNQLAPHVDIFAPELTHSWETRGLRCVEMP